MPPPWESHEHMRPKHPMAAQHFERLGLVPDGQPQARPGSQDGLALDVPGA
jgi:hypothetical protein